jgi:hypothetical protein
LPPTTYLLFDGAGSYVEVADDVDFSIETTGALTVAAWLRPDALVFPRQERGYVHWMGKGERGDQEWVARMYSGDNTVGRANRISFYVFNPEGGQGIGSYFQDPRIEAGHWIHFVGSADGERTAIYENGVLKKTDAYTDAIRPAHGPAPVRFGTRDFGSFFLGGLGLIRFWSRPLSDGEIADLYSSDLVPPDGLVAEYLLGEGDGEIAHDTANGHDGALIGAVFASDAGADAGLRVQLKTGRLEDD